MIINGGIECRPGGSLQERNRAKYYTEFAGKLDVTVSGETSCSNKGSFDRDGSFGAIGINWERDFSYQQGSRAPPCRAIDSFGNAVSYQTGYVVPKACDFHQCVQRKFDVTIIDDLDGMLPFAALILVSIYRNILSSLFVWQSRRER